MITEQVRDFWRDTVAALYERVPIHFEPWLNTEFFLSREATNSNGPFRCYPIQRGLAFFYSDLRIVEVNVQKCGQAGCTQILKGLCGYEVSVRGRNMAVIQPTQGFANWFSNLQLRTLLRDCPSVAAELRVDPEKRNDPQNTTKLRLFNRAALYCRGANSSNDFRGYSVMTIAVDEVDSAPIDIDEEGTVDALASSRIKEATYPKQINQSTPTIAGRSRIQALTDAIHETHSFRYHVRCTSCDAYQELLWGGEDATFGIQWDKIYHNPEETNEDKLVVDKFETSKTARYKCGSCGDTFLHSDLRDLDEGGRWQSSSMFLDTDRQELYLLGDDPETAEPQTPPYKVAVYLRGTHSYVSTWSRAVYDFLEAVEFASKGDPAKLIKFQNAYLGEVHEPLRNQDLASWESLRDRAREPEDGAECPEWVQYISAGTDTGKNHIAYEVVGWGPDYESISLEYRRIECNPQVDSTLRETLGELSSRRFRKASGEEIPVSLVLSDSKYAGAMVREACATNPRKLIPITGYGTIGAAPIRMSTNPEPHTGVFVGRIGIQTCADTLAELFKVTLPEGKDRAPGHAHFPVTPYHNEQYFKELCGEVIRTTYKNGRPESKWVQKSKAIRVEATDCRRYAYAGVKLAELRYGFNFMSDSDFAGQKSIRLAATADAQNKDLASIAAGWGK